MGYVIDVDEQGAEVALLTETGSGGLLGGRLLHDAPLETYLTDAERPQYVLSNKKDGVHIDRGDEEQQVAPDEEYRMLAAVTDVRIVFVIGRVDGDLVYSVPLLDVVSVGVDDGFVTSSLWIETEEAHYECACRGELAPVAEHIDGLAQATVRAYRLLDDARDCLEAAENHRSDDRFEPALDAVATAKERLEQARERLDSVGSGALAAFDEDSAGTRRQCRVLPRAIHGDHARHAHTAAQSSWQDGEYEAAHDTYETARTACRNAIHAPGDEPSDEALSERCDQLEDERDALQRAPLADAQQVAHGAASVDGPAPAAERWERAIRRYQEVLWLDWGRDERRFDGDPEAVRESIINAVDHVVTERRAAARACREAAHTHQLGGAPDAARDAYRTALTQLERASEIADEIAPTRETGLEDTKAAIEDELAGVPERAGHAEGTPANRRTDSARTDGALWWAVVAEHWTAHGWTVDREDGGLLATKDAPLERRAYISVGGSQRTASPEAVEHCSEMARFVDADLAVLTTVEDPGPPVQERAAECDVFLQNLSDLATDYTASTGNEHSA